MPVGTILEYGGSEAPENWLFLDGSAVSRYDYAELFEIYGTKYGAGDGSTTFNLPDFRGRVPVGLNEADTDFDTLGNTGGEKTHKLTVAEMPSHNHGLTVRGSSYSTAWIIDFQNVTGQSTSTGSTGGSQAHNNLQPYIVVNYIVKAKSDTADYTLTEEKDIKTLLWTNPSPGTEFAAQTIELDLSEYDSVCIEYRPFYSYSGTKSVTAPVGTTALGDLSMSNLGLVNGTNTYNGFRHMEITETGINVQQGYNHSAADNRSVIPVRIYGVKNKINITTPVVTDKGQHTDLLWENAVPSAGFAAQTLELDLSDYDAVEIAYYGQIAGSLSLNFYGLKSEICLKNEYSSLDSIAFIGASNTSGYAFTRNLQVLDTGIIFDSGYSGYTDGSGGASSTQAGVPCKIYGIKFNAATTSTIMEDYIIEQGTEGIWTYRKWNSGIAECWGIREITVAAKDWVAWGSLYYKHYEQVNYPFTFISTPYEIIQVQMTGGNGMTNAYPNNTATTTGHVDIVRPTVYTNAVNGWIKYYVKGRWK